MKKDTREILLDAATEVLSKNPGAYMGEVAETAGVGRATLYRHFPSRDDLIRELTIASYKQMDAALAPVMAKDLSAKDMLLALLEEIIPLGDRYNFLLSERSFEDDPEVRSFEDRNQQDWGAFFEELKTDGVIAPDVPTAWAVATIEALIYSAWSSASDGYIATRDAPKLVYRTLLSGLGPKS
ncbi:MAG: TetR/AcrR family transcriptional regulator [Chloroflexi bacterium]|nr:MAG: TetR/AcrR family transcriptional regulator [Chloroflexota bacterium]MBL1193213.1 TetR/AcrR family transcriptional regulator [Chloroflexota bacterium]NOH10507.1 TetR/AcrR family transcriptional regulator [Chloroflexota bacterium]